MQWTTATLAEAPGGWVDEPRDAAVVEASVVGVIGYRVVGVEASVVGVVEAAVVGVVEAAVVRIEVVRAEVFRTHVISTATRSDSLEVALHLDRALVRLPAGVATVVVLEQLATKNSFHNPVGKIANSLNWLSNGIDTSFNNTTGGIDDCICGRSRVASTVYAQESLLQAKAVGHDIPLTVGIFDSVPSEREKRVARVRIGTRGRTAVELNLLLGVLRGLSEGTAGKSLGSLHADTGLLAHGVLEVLALLVPSALGVLGGLGERFSTAIFRAELRPVLRSALVGNRVGDTFPRDLAECRDCSLRE